MVGLVKVATTMAHLAIHGTEEAAAVGTVVEVHTNTVEGARARASSIPRRLKVARWNKVATPG